MSGLAPIPDEPLHCSEPPLWADAVEKGLVIFGEQ
jgi:hypothetical protein